MRFDKITPTPRLQPYISQLVISENDMAGEYKVLPSTSMVMGFQYQGQLSRLNSASESRLSSAGITGLADSFSLFKNTAHTHTILVYFTETGLAHFCSCPANELFNQSISLDNIFTKNKLSETEERLSNAATDQQRIHIVEEFLLSQLKDISQDKLIMEAVKMIYDAKGAIKIKELNERLFISQSPFEKRFRKLVGTTPKKFASIVRFNTVLGSINRHKTLTEICYDNQFFDQAHFIKDFKQFTGETPEQYRRFL